MLHDWRGYPGRQDDGTLDEAAMQNCVEHAASSFLTSTGETLAMS
ncbi:hypothetical protein [Microbacterium sp. Yaish 1]|nr:hypothetical protein [Microbacterium sp. Yaish 1]